MASLSPETVFFSITNECIMRCKVCSMWELRDPPDALSMEERLAVIDQLEEFEAPIHVVVTGGEPFTKFRQILGMAKRIKDQGNTMAVVTSGFLLTPNVVDQLVNCGITNLSISLDFPTEAQHDAQRGRVGTFARICEALERLSRFREEGCVVPQVGVNCILMAQNLNYIEDLILKVSRLGVSEILFQPIQPDFAIDDSVSRNIFRNWLPMDPSRVDSVIDEIETLRDIVPLEQTEAEFDVIKKYFRNPLRLPPGSCKSAERNLMVDVSGYVTHCFGQARTGIKPLGRVPAQNIVSLWRSETAELERAVLKNCTFGCGALLCHSRSSIPRQVLPAK